MVVHSLEFIGADRIGKGGLSSQSLAAGMERALQALARVKEEFNRGDLPVLKVPYLSQDLVPLRDVVSRLSPQTTDIFVLGTGGSSLGGQTLAQLKDYMVPGASFFAGQPRLHFLDNLDPWTLSKVLKRPLQTCRFLAISKSGSTGETLLQTIAVLQALEVQGLRMTARDRIVGVSEPSRPGIPNSLRTLLEPEGVSFLPHPPDVGGRYSVLTVVGLLPAAFLGVDGARVRRGAGHILDDLLHSQTPETLPSILGAAYHMAATAEGKGITVLKAYGDRLERLTRWWIQLWAESLGKEGMGLQPVGALGPVDQHSQQQLYLDGPLDKIFTVLTNDTRGWGTPLDVNLTGRANLSFLAHRTVGDFVDAQAQAMLETFANRGRPVRHIHIPRLDEEYMGGLLMHFMLETIITGYGLGLNPFDQPAVEEAKIATKRYLTESMPVK